MSHYPVAPLDADQGQWVYGRWDPDLVTELLSHMTPQQARLDVQSKDFDAVAEQIKQARPATPRRTKYMDDLKAMCFA